MKQLLINFLNKNQKIYNFLKIKTISRINNIQFLKICKKMLKENNCNLIKHKINLIQIKQIKKKKYRVSKMIKQINYKKQTKIQ